MTLLRNHGWRGCLVLAGVLLIYGGSMHPSADAEDPIRQELATMIADERWVPGHSLTLAGIVLLAAGLWTAYRVRAWSEISRPLLVGAIAFSLYAVEAAAHLLAFVDAAALANGEAAPVAFAHLGLGTVLYPVSGWALVYLAWSMGRAGGGLRRPIAAVGIVAGLLHAFSVPAALMLPDTELSWMFASAAILIAVWSILVGLAGAPARRRTPERSVAASA